MQKGLFEYQDYKLYLTKWIGRKERGEKSRIAQALHCHLAYVSQVLSGDAQFSLEQAEALNHHLGHNEKESDFFLLLVSFERAGSNALQSYFKNKLNHALEERKILQNRLHFKKTLTFENQAIYYSAWSYVAVHLLMSIPQFQTQEKVAAYLELPVEQVAKILEFLVSVGLVTQAEGRYQSGKVSIHLGADSPMLVKHHMNWRMKAIQSLDWNSAEDLHYSSVISMAKKDAPEVRKILLEAIEKIRGLVRNSPEEELFCYCLDFFEI